MPHKRREKSRKTSVLHRGTTFFQVGERRFTGPDELLNSGGQFRGCIAQSNGSRMKNPPFRNCLPHCLTKCLRPKRPTLSLKKHFWPPKQNITNEKTAQHCFTKCLRPKKRTLSLKKHFWPVKRQQNFIRNNDTALPYKMTEPKNQHLHRKNKCGLQNATNSHEI